MMAFHKSTQTPFCVYFTREEAENIANECAEALSTAYRFNTQLPETQRLFTKLRALLDSPDRKRA
ncbi:hypothetical protein F0344_04815 [Streptomyces finlayi]|uniref:Uncharacterized protein n=1 Tax=Streptomyces finlayi TaxID=67296 RepID=A0A7G7BF99_9ACTN|nr:hypothetical protein [Streptomyces finlayi]QNE74014.1 hypothetical protein F0344_04815 [Streptomyces finlayi]